MKLIKVKNEKEMAIRASYLLISEILKKPDLTVGFASGSTAKKLYKELVKESKRRNIDFSKIKTFNLDEYYPISKKSKNSFYYYMHKNLFDKVNVNKANVNLLNGETKNPKKECENYEKKIKKNPIDVQILGLGVNGHVGFNEPGSTTDSRTRLVELSKQTRKSNSRFFQRISSVPHRALTVGIKTILSSKKIILMANGRKKARAIEALVKGKPNKECPASLLKKHKNLTVIFDKKAGCLL